MVSMRNPQKRYRKLTQKNTYIYVLGGARGPKKIGIGISPIARLKSAQIGHSHELAVLFAKSIPRDLAGDIERRSFWLLKEKKVRGELFKIGLSTAKAAIEQAISEGGVGEKARSVGRPPLNTDSVTKPTMVRLTADVRQRIEAIVGPNRMAVFIREAIEGELERREQPDRSASSPRSKGSPPARD